MKIVGVGCGPGMLTEEAIRVIRKARLIYGSKRALAFARQYLRKGCTVTVLTDYSALHSLPENAVIVSTGDPMLAGLGYLPGEVISGISSLQVASARLKIPLDRITPVVAHGTRHAEAMEKTLDELGRGRVVFLIADPKFDVTALYLLLQGTGDSFTIAVCENIGYPDESIRVGKGSDLPRPSRALYSLMIGHF